MINKYIPWNWVYIAINRHYIKTWYRPMQTLGFATTKMSLDIIAGGRFTTITSWLMGRWDEVYGWYKGNLQHYQSMHRLYVPACNICFSPLISHYSSRDFHNWKLYDLIAYIWKLLSACDEMCWDMGNIILQYSYWTSSFWFYPHISRSIQYPINSYLFFMENNIPMAQCKTTVSPLLRQWRYCSLAPSHWYNIL